MTPTKTDAPPGRPPRSRVTAWREAAALAPVELRTVVEALDDVSLPPVNTSLVSPVGFDAFSDDGPGTRRPIADLRTLSDGTLRIVSGRTRVATFTEPALLTTGDLAALRDFAAVRVPFGAGAGPVELTRLVRQLLVAGVPLLAPDLPLAVRRLLGPELGELAAALTQDDVADPDRREQWSVQARRAALLAATTAGGVPSSRPTVTAVVVPDDPQRFSDLVRDLRAQTWTDLTVVVAAAGGTVPERLPSDWTVVQAASQAEAVREALLARDSDLATVVTSLLSYGPDHVRDLVLGHRYGGQPVTGVLARRAYLAPLDLTVRAPGPRTEQPTAQLTAGAILATPATLLTARVWDASGAQPFAVSAGYAIHDRQVYRTVRDVGPELNEVLRLGGRQVPGRADRPFAWPAGRQPDASPGRVDAAFVSYFARTAADVVTSPG